MGESTPVSDPENISTMKLLLAVVALFATLACALAEPEPEAYRGYYRGKRSADAEPEAEAVAAPEADAEAAPWGRYYGGYGYGYPRAYGYYGYGRRYGKRSADAEPEAEAAPWGRYYGGYYGRGYYGGYRGYGYGYGYYG